MTEININNFSEAMNDKADIDLGNVDSFAGDIKVVVDSKANQTDVETSITSINESINTGLSQKANLSLDNILANIDYVVESKFPTESDESWYRVYKSGWVEQGGVMSTSNTVYFPIEMANTYYYIDVTWNGGKSSTFYPADWIITRLDTTYFYTSATSNGANVKGLTWIVKGQKAQ